MTAEPGSSRTPHAGLVAVDAAIAAHPLSSDRVTRAHAIIETSDRDDRASVEARLADADLPGLAELGRIQVRHSLSWWRLHRRRRRILARLDR
ncbi:hypothetical protein ACR8AL_00470 [Clavibacter sepedonicus]|uniref:hypothetical protein n=1 Tax=Clavibacter TaxID=1573 RepID=UPI00059C057B|nr:MULTISPECIES: hypothetical protein [Clavibacter]MBD5380304.1 hypothetical protein [Clavibacter sp.]OQJ48085.1 hypothetical protein B5P19_07160 [Clavibacter sepedonicus]OQJ54670.1 hypothetical protein B5P20_11620 [Clavibacter sepedonicus]UUK66251.1 hypothetical protein LRE50_03220 [Clavibacter sepedonicus]